MSNDHKSNPELQIWQSWHSHRGYGYWDTLAEAELNSDPDHDPVLFVPAQEQAAPSDEEIDAVFEEIVGPSKAGLAIQLFARALLARYGGRPTAGMVSVTQHDANSYVEILRELGMEDDGDPVAAVRRLIDLTENKNDRQCTAESTYYSSDGRH